MKTLIAPTVTVRTAVLVNKDSLETVSFVKVRQNFKQAPVGTEPLGAFISLSK